MASEAGQRPGRGGPDDGVDLLAGERRVERRGLAGERVAHVDAGAGVHLVLHLGLGQGGAVVPAPVDGLEPAVDEAALEELVEGLERGGLVLVGHGGVRVLPAAEHADALELGALQIDVLLGVGAAGGADGDGVHLQLFAAKLLVHFDFDGQAVAVPSWDIGRVEAGHGLRLDDEVLQALVQGVAQVDGAIGVGRSVVQDVLRSALARLANLLVEAAFRPCCEPFRLIFRQIRLHREAGARQQKGRLQLRPAAFGMGRLGVWLGVT